MINLGENGAPAENDVTDALIKLRSRVSVNTKIVVMVPVSGKARSQVTTAFNAYKSSSNDPRAYLVDLGSITFATCDGCHPTAAGHRTIYAAAVPAFDEIVLQDDETVGESPFDIATAMEPFWSSTTMHNESVLMTSLDGSLPQASLLFAPSAIIAVKDAALQKEYLPGLDFTVENGVLKLLPGSSAPWLTGSQLYPSTADNRTMAKNGGGYVLWSEGHYIQRLQLAVTYKHGQGTWNGPRPHYQSDSLPVVTDKLKNGKPVKIVYFGDSILEGFNASGYLCQDATTVSPFMPSWGQLVTDDLKRYYSSPLSARNAAVAGKNTTWGVENVHALVTTENPDLVVIAFGMNDGSANLDPATFKANIQAMISDVRLQNPSAEFIVVSPTLANPETGFAGRQAEYAAVLRELNGIGTVLVDMTGVHQELLKRKAFRDMTGNNINHPNDFLIRWYAQEVSGMLVPESQSPLSARRNVALASFGGLASASSTINNNFNVYAVNNGDRRGYDWQVGRNGGGWNDNTANSFPDWVQIQFPAAQAIDEIDVFTVQDAYQTPGEPTSEMIFTQYGITDFEVQYWNGSTWSTVPGGSVTGNNKVRRKFTFSPVNTDRIRVLVNNALNAYSRIIELEAYAEAPTSNFKPVGELRPREFNAPITITTRHIPAGLAISASCSAAMSGPDHGTIQIAVFDAHGRRMPGVHPVQSSAPAALYTWNTRGVPNGMYFVHARLGTHVTTRRLNILLPSR
jgi:lysophospholipase L1-like esterase